MKATTWHLPNITDFTAFVFHLFKRNSLYPVSLSLSLLLMRCHFNTYTHIEFELLAVSRAAPNNVKRNTYFAGCTRYLESKSMENNNNAFICKQ